MTSPEKPQKRQKNTIVPPAQVTKIENSIRIICQLHGIPEEKIRIDLEKTRLTISVPKENERVMKKITVPAGSRISTKKFHDGILELILEQPV